MSKKNRRDITSEYIALEQHPDGDDMKPPFPCNRWCKKVVKTHDGEVVEETVMPWLDECKGNKIACGAVWNPEAGKAEPVFRDHLGFDEIDYMVLEENAFKKDEEGNIILTKDESTGAEVPEADFRYVAGINAVNFIAEHTFRIASMSANSGQNIMSAVQSVNNNVVQLCKIQSHMVKLIAPEEAKSKITGVQDQSAIPDGAGRIAPL